MKLDAALNALNYDASVDDREDIIRLLVGLKHQYQAFAISMASSKESITRDKMLTILQEKPLHLSLTMKCCILLTLDTFGYFH